MAKILIVDDNPMNIEMASELLMKAGHRVLTAENAKLGIKIAKIHTPDLILMDLGLSGVDGLSATKTLKDDPLTKDIKIVAFTASAMKTDKEKAYGAGCIGFISKPINIYNFSKIVEKYINSKVNVINFKKQINEESLEIAIKKNANNEEELCESVNQKEKKYKWHKILIVEDNVMNAELLKEVLEQIGQSAVIANKGNIALDLLKEEKFDLILLDIMMPELNGFEVIKILKNNPKTAEIPVIFITALNDIKDIVEGLDLGSYGYITKPYNVEELKARVLSILRIKDLQDELQSEKTKLDMIYKFSADGIIMVNSAFKVVSCNDTFCDWLQKSKNEILNKNLFAFINTPANFKFTNNKNIEKLDEIYIGPQNNKKIIELNCSAINPEGIDSAEGYILIMRDVTTQKEIEKQKETFVATLTHDLKTPIRAEIRAMELLLKGSFGQLNTDQKEIVEDILHSGKYMFKMIDNLLSTYRFENGCNKLEKTAFDIHNLIKECYKDVKYIAEDKKQNIILNFEDEIKIISADEVEIRRVIQNLLSNAVHYTPENGKIIIETKNDDKYFSVSFIDNGKGIPQSQIEEIFNKYKSEAKKFKQVGTGLGLYLSKKIIESHGGELLVKSEEGKGCKFTFNLPLISNLINCQ